MAHVLFSESAKSDLLEAWVFIAEENIAAADDWFLKRPKHSVGKNPETHQG